MSRSDDLGQAERQIAAKQAEIQTIQANYVAYHDEVTATIKDILEEADVYDQIHEMELERLDVQKKAQDKIQGIQQAIAKLNAAKEFLQGLANKAPKTEEPLVEDSVSESPSEDVGEDAPVVEPVKESGSSPKSPIILSKKPKPPAF